MKRNLALENAIFDYIENNSGVDSIDITLYFKVLTVDKTLASLQQLIDDGRIGRRELWGLTKHEYYII